MKRRELLSRLPLILLAVPLVSGCAANDEDDDYPTRPAGGGGGGGGIGEPEEQAGAFMVANQDDSGHSHTFEVTCGQLEAGVTTYTAEGAHTHQVPLTEEQIADILDGRRVTVQTSAGHAHTWIVQMPARLCA